jgi:hypothetical protein
MMHILKLTCIAYNKNHNKTEATRNSKPQSEDVSKLQHKKVATASPVHITASAYSAHYENDITTAKYAKSFELLGVMSCFIS